MKLASQILALCLKVKEKFSFRLFEKNCFLLDYGDFSIEDVFPLYGPMCGNQKVCVEIKGHLPKDFKTDFIINITENRINRSYQVKDIKKSGNNMTFHMPAFQNAQIDRAEVKIVFEYRQERMGQAIYTYTRALDSMYKNIFLYLFSICFFVEELDRTNSNESTIDCDVGLSSSNSSSALPIRSSTGM
jgi:hypothetical protein